jgi:N-glycosylase/DNA lyase
MDVWMKRAMAVLLPGKDGTYFGKDAGVAQQYLFHFSRMHPERFSKET